ncbi:helix-turn-helix domain-containing protein [Asticcacaulis sp. DXS10W]|uniref:Helix-turn-helix domain-containing protein n=1 Tax=Asticcacaulis currens TaxID=2984210 RepID=A0ABT5IDK7_9CAUL|nr:helix-turn-helix domain-containing protein [Asticcacaulis currens]
MDHHEWIKGALRLRGSSFADVARRTGVTAAAVYYVSKGKSRSSRVETAIAEIIGYSPAEIWGYAPLAPSNNGGAMPPR